MIKASGSVLRISISPRKGRKKDNVPSARLVAGSGLEGDAHAGPWNRQVSLLPHESFEKLGALAKRLRPGDFAENITTRGIDLSTVRIGDRIRVGRDARLEVTQIGKTCHEACAIRKTAGDCIMPREGIFARVLDGGTIRPGDPVRLLRASDPLTPSP